MLLAIAFSLLAQDADPWPAPLTPRPPASATPKSGQPDSVRTLPAGHRRWMCQFQLSHQDGWKQVSLVGAFNAWSPQAHPLQKVGRPPQWKIRVPLESGIHPYKFVVNGRDWIPDPSNPRQTPDGFGGNNSLLMLGPYADLRTSPAAVGDGRIGVPALNHDPQQTFFLQSLGPEQVLVRYETLSEDVEAIHCVMRPSVAVPMQAVVVGPLYTVWEVSVPRPARNTRYTFVLADGSLRGRHPEIYTFDMDDDSEFQTPEWAKHAVWYQIMVDRFHNGDPANDPEHTRPWRSAWFSHSPWEGQDGQTFYEYFVYSRHYGGDLQGLRAKLPYLSELGVNALYLNPVFKASTHHKYNATNFLHIDDHFGSKGDYEKIASKEDLLRPHTWKWTPSDELFLQFIREAKEQGFRIIIDGVFNHVGTAHPAFRDVRRKGKKSQFSDWFEITSWKPFRYEGWAGFGELPVFKKSEHGFISDAVKQHIFDVTRRWMDPDGDGDPSDGVDGWRLDVPNEVPMPFWEEWRQLVKEINPEAYISGEIWGRADDWLKGRHFDAVMNYEFAKVVLAWIGHQTQKISASDCDRRLSELRLAYPAAATYVMQNLVDSHDTDRLVSMLQNPDREYDRMNRPQDDNREYDNSKPGELAYKRARLVALLQMCYVGAPMIYYGDEVGMWGADDPTNRKPMLWEELQPYEEPEENFVMHDLLEHYRKIIRVRNQFVSLRVGDIRTLLVDDERDLWVFMRQFDEEQVLIALNPSDQPHTVELQELEDWQGSWTVEYGHPQEPGGSTTSLSFQVNEVDGLVLRRTRN